mmetsp:Transcript_11845/g.22170  ORF Transcript_11845/g.22170 Transcript_11845/m.22170 type:complete len:235 (-) Transcript_11845:860-1564(-)
MRPHKVIPKSNMSLRRRNHRTNCHFILGKSPSLVGKNIIQSTQFFSCWKRFHNHSLDCQLSYNRSQSNDKCHWQIFRNSRNRQCNRVQRTNQSLWIIRIGLNASSRRNTNSRIQSRCHNGQNSQDINQTIHHLLQGRQFWIRFSHGLEYLTHLCTWTSLNHQGNAITRKFRPHKQPRGTLLLVLSFTIINIHGFTMKHVLVHRLRFSRQHGFHTKTIHILFQYNRIGRNNISRL